MRLALLLVLLSMATLSAQTVRGKITDAKSGEELIGANVFLQGTTIGTASDIDGNYVLYVEEGEFTITAAYVGYTSVEKQISVTGDMTLHFSLKEDVTSQEVIVSAQRAKQRETPVAISNIELQEIQENIAAKDITSVLQAVPGVHVTEQGGASGDSRVSLRGFSQENIAVMINGVPVNDMENRYVYWSNWSALSDITRSIQTQRGLGASTLSTAAVGGILNMIVKPADAEFGYKYKQDIGEDGLYKETAIFNSGLINETFALSAMVSKKDYAGYADMTASEEYSWFFGASAFFTGAGDHALHMSAFGTPQERERRSWKRGEETWEKYGRNYNPNVGVLDTLTNKKLNLAKNKYHKPAYNINHIWDMNGNTSLTTVLYASLGRGYGESFTGGPSTESYRREKDDLYDLHTYINENKGQIANKRVLAQSFNSHNWYGFTSTLNHKSGINNLILGLDGRLYEGIHYREISNLFGLDAYDENATAYQYNPLIRSKALGVGDKFAYNYRGYVNQAGIFLQDEIRLNKQLYMFGNFSYSYVDYDYEDIYNQVSKENAPNVTFEPITIKTGLNYNLDDANNVYFNMGQLQQTPNHRSVYGNDAYTSLRSNFVLDDRNPDGFARQPYVGFDSNPKKYANSRSQSPYDKRIEVDPSLRSIATTDGVKVETIQSLEFGYGYKSDWVAVNVNAYRTVWKDKSIVVRFENLNGTSYSYNVTGLQALHQGLEIDGKMKPIKDLELSGSFSYQNNTWANNAGYSVSNESGGQGESGIFFLNDVYVGDAPMTTVTGAIKYYFNFSRELYGNIQFSGKLNKDYYAGFTVDDRNYQKEGEIIQPTQIPDYGTWKLSANMYYKPEDMFVKRIKIGLNIFNLFDTDYISDAFIDRNRGHEVFYGRPRNITTSFTFEF